jgi:hypothetical protein
MNAKWPKEYDFEPDQTSDVLRATLEAGYVLVVDFCMGLLFKHKERAVYRAVTFRLNEVYVLDFDETPAQVQMAYDDICRYCCGQGSWVYRRSMETMEYALRPQRGERNYEILKRLMLKDSPDPEHQLLESLRTG